jgi:L-ascorbate metabolism protein UlaG (beta-lactamase superfamily)
MLFFFLLFVLIITIFFLAKKNAHRSYYKGSITNHFDGEKFHNLKKNDSKTNDKVVLNYFKKKLLGESASWPSKIAVNSINPLKILNDNNDVIFLINHATTLIKTSNYNILTDPIWSNCTSPVKFIGPRRKADPGIRFEDLPEIHIVLISHNHYDHLDLSTIKMLIKNHDPVFIVGLGVGGTLSQMGVKKDKIIELDWWQNFNHQDISKSIKSNLEITFVPAQHFSSRFFDDKNSTLWGGFTIKSENRTIYFAGDTGYDSEQFAQIREKIGKINVSILPIGAYKPDSFRYVHMNPDEAVKASILLGSEVNIPMHYGTFILSFENYEDPIRDLYLSLKKHNLPKDHFSILKNGEYTSE